MSTAPGIFLAAQHQTPESFPAELESPQIAQPSWKSCVGRVAIDLQSGKPLWTQPLPAAPVPWGLAIDRAGRVLVTLVDGRILCFDRPA